MLSSSLATTLVVLLLWTANLVSANFLSWLTNTAARAQKEQHSLHDARLLQLFPPSDPCAGYKQLCEAEPACKRCSNTWVPVLEFPLVVSCETYTEYYLSGYPEGCNVLTDEDLNKLAVCNIDVSLSQQFGISCDRSAKDLEITASPSAAPTAAPTSVPSSL
jgi:hypothetical protein